MAGYGTDSGFDAWLNDNGYTLPGDAPAPAVLRERGSQYIDALYGSRFAGAILSVEQERQWPRESVIIGGKLVPPDLVPGAVINASYLAAYQEATSPGSLSAVGSAASAVTREKVGQIEVQYASGQSDGTAMSITPLMSTVDGMLRPFLLDREARGLGIWSVGCR
jgi:hypothetical protein